MSLNVITIQASEHTIKSVTVSKSSKAEVVRTFALDLRKGQNKVEIKCLPSGIETARPSGLGAARLDDFLYTVEGTKPRPTKPFGESASPSESASSEAVRLLSVKLATLEKEKQIREAESNFLLQYAHTLKGEHVAPSDMILFLDTYVKHTTKSVHAANEINEKIVEIRRQIETEEAKATLKTGEAHGRVMALINSDMDTSITFILTYIVQGCEWKPKYELHTTTEGGKPSTTVSLHYLATIFQNTGEDWTDATLTLSTTTTNLRPKGVPTAAPLKIRLNSANGNVFTNTGGFKQGQTNARGGFGPFAGQAPAKFGQPAFFGAAPAPAPSLFGAAQSATQQQQPAPQLFGGGPSPSPFGAPAPGAVAPATQAFGAQSSSQITAGYDLVSDFQSLQVPSSTAADEYVPSGQHNAGDEGSLGSAPEAASVVQETPLSMYFAVNGKASIPSDGLKHRVTLAVLPFESKMSYVTIPRDDPTVFLQCEVKNTSEYRLIAGPMDVTVDGSYITATLIPNDINPGETFECFLGNDISTKVTYVRSSKITRPEASAFSEGTVIATYTTKITIQNKHPYDLPALIVRDRMPTSDDQRVRVILRQPLELGDTKQGQFVSLKDGGLKIGWEKAEGGRGGEKEGKFEWRWKVKSGATVELLAEYDVKGPKDLGWDIQATPYRVKEN
ncbi:hypothetical protein BJ912DRAFT_960894 [Pholiota molesta]|nr:hypothetical protein BJ912DRAFT_960894 [Pholiota molesta]